MKEHTSKIFKDTAVVIVANILNYAGMFVIAVMISRMLGVEALGEFTYIIAVTSVLSIIAEFGLSQLIIRKLNSDRSQVFLYIKNINLFKFILSLICIICALTILTAVNQYFFKVVYAAGLALIIPKAFQSTYEAAIRSLKIQTLPALIKSINTFVQIILSYFVLNTYGNILSVFAVLLITEIITAAAFRLSYFKVWRPYRVQNERSQGFADIKPVITESFPFFGSNFLSFSIQRIIIIILGNLTPGVSVGIYSAASRFSNGIGLVSGALYNTIYPVMTDPSTGNITRYLIAKKFIKYSLLTGAVFTAVIYGLAEFLIDITFKIPEAVPVLKLLAFTVLPILVYSVIQPYLFAINKEKYVLRIYSVIWIVNILSGIFAIHHHNYLGAAINSIIIEYSLLVLFLLIFLKYKPAQ